MSDIIVGIDLGTTNSEIAWVGPDGRPEVLAYEGELIMPSVVGFTPQGELLVGTPARNQLALHPDRTVRSIKRKMGTDERIELGAATLTPPEVSALILKELVRRARLATGEAIGKAVITVPAFFHDAQRQATRQAGEIAGLEVVRIINEPTAAVLAYGGGFQSGKERLLLVYDLGGGTFDVSVVLDDGEMTEVLASHGDTFLGGDDFDERLLGRLAEAFLKETGVDPRADRLTRARLRDAAEAAKIRLTEATFTRVREEFLARDAKNNPLHLDHEVTRETYEELISPLLEKTLDSVHEALRAAGRSRGEVDEILLVGGATRTPLVADRLRTVTELAPRQDLHPDLSVALGAAVLGGRLAGRSPGRVLVDVTPYSFGPSHAEWRDGRLDPDRYRPVINRNTALPVTRAHTYCTMYDDQEGWDVRIFQGESPNARENILIGRFLAEGFSPAPAGSPIVCTMHLDLDGLLTVEVLEKQTGLKKKVTIEKATATFDEAALAEARRRTAALWSDARGAAEEDEAAAPAAASSQPAGGEEGEPTPPDILWKSVERMLARARAVSDRMVVEDREGLAALERTLEEAQARADREAARKALEELSDLVHYVEEV
ncbi:MAG: Hsp70 family protein [Planctomycetes bacterium]|nr:Hsp70 family protein [Planctomycetota bacterium]